MDTASDAPLAVDGGPRTVTTDDPERWERPVERQKEVVNELIERGEISAEGRGVSAAFEERFRKHAGANYCTVTDHGSTALASAYYAVGVGPGDEVITPTAGYLGAYEGALHLGARPIFCECDPETLNADPDDIEDRITDRTAAINVTHFNGRACDMDALLAIRDEYDIPIVEDAAHAHATHWDGQHIGSVGDICCFSLQGVSPGGKPLAGGEGGIVTTNDREYYERQLAYAHLHRTGLNDELTREPYSNLDWEGLGRKWRAHPLALAIADVEMDSLDERTAGRLAFRDELFAALDAVPGVRPVYPYEKSEEDGLYGGLRVVFEPDELDGDVSAERFVEALQAEGAPAAGPGFPYVEHRRYIHREGFDLWGDDRGPLGGEWHGLPPYEGHKDGDFPVTEDLNERVISVDSFIDPEPGYVEEVATAFRKVADRHDEL